MSSSLFNIYIVTWSHEVGGIMCRDAVCASTSKIVAERAAAAVAEALSGRGGDVVVVEMVDGIISQPSPLTAEAAAKLNAAMWADGGDAGVV